MDSYEEPSKVGELNTRFLTDKRQAVRLVGSWMDNKLSALSEAYCSSSRDRQPSKSKLFAHKWKHLINKRHNISSRVSADGKKCSIATILKFHYRAIIFLQRNIIKEEKHKNKFEKSIQIMWKNVKFYKNKLKILYFFTIWEKKNVN